MFIVEMVMCISLFVFLFIMMFELLLWFSYIVIFFLMDVNFFNDLCIEKIFLIFFFIIFDGWELSYIYVF